MKWEYKMIDRTRGYLTAAELNTLGAEGWEFCCTISGPTTSYFYFKRPLP